MKVVVTLLLTVLLLSAYGQEESSDTDTLLLVKTVISDSSTVTKAAGLQYAASGWKRWWWGDHYRQEWVTPVSFPILHISNLYGGLTPTKMGGGHQSKSLRLVTQDGKEYVLRTIDKSLDLLVPDYLKGTALNDILNDQISTAHPYGPIAISHLAEAVHLPHTNPRIYYVASDPSLGEFNSIFANKLSLLEERPSGKGWEHNAGFEDADDIVNTEKMLEKVYSSSKNAVDQPSYLRVRLFDMVVNDWDRHEDQWVWAIKKSDNKNLYKAIGRDRDQAFSRTDGTALFFLSLPWAFRPLKNFVPEIKDVKGINFAARNLDQQFLNELTSHHWKVIIDSIQANLTNQVIETSVKKMPEEVNKHSGERIMNRLEQRRDNLSTSGMKYYSALSRRATINGSAKNETFIVDFNNENEVAVTGLQSSSKDTFYHRVFYRNETREINLYGLEGKDQFIAKGNVKNNFVIRLIGGPGDNEYTGDEKLGGKKLRVYDSLPVQNISTKVFKRHNRWDTLYNYRRASVKYNWFMPLITPGFNADDGFSIGLGILYRKQQWGKKPFGWEQQFGITYATGTSAVGFEYAGLFKNTFGRWDLDINAFYKGPRYTFFYYGLGNEIELNGRQRPFFRVKANDFYISPGTSRTWGSHSLRFGLQFESVEVLRNQDKFVTSPSSDVDPSIFSVRNFAGVNGKWDFFNAGNIKYPTRGFHLNAGFSFLNNLTVDRRFVKLGGSATIYHTFFKFLTFAHRTGVATNVGDFDFYHGNALGLDNNLRGFWKSRFTGRSSFYQNTELRLRAAQLKGYYLRGTLGFYGFIDDGRVWQTDETSSTLHVGYGGGVYFLPYNALSLTLFYAKSKEVSALTVKAGFFL